MKYTEINQKNDTNVTLIDDGWANNALSMCAGAGAVVAIFPFNDQSEDDARCVVLRHVSNASCIDVANVNRLWQSIEEKLVAWERKNEHWRMCAFWPIALQSNAISFQLTSKHLLPPIFSYLFAFQCFDATNREIFEVKECKKNRAIAPIRRYGCV